MTDEKNVSDTSNKSIDVKISSSRFDTLSEVKFAFFTTEDLLKKIGPNDPHPTPEMECTWRELLQMTDEQFDERYRIHEESIQTMVDTEPDERKKSIITARMLPSIQLIEMVRIERKIDSMRKLLAERCCI